MRGILKVGALGLLKHRKSKSMENFWKNTWQVAQNSRLCTVADWEPYETSKIKLLENIVNGFQPLIIFVKASIFDFYRASEFTHILSTNFFQWTFNDPFNGCFRFQISATL